MYKIIACDLDETLLNSERKVSMKDRESIKKATELGVKFVLATGRGFPSVDGTLKEVDLFQKPDEYVISFNGGAITENLGNRLIDAELMDFDIVNQLFKRGWNYDVCIHVYTLDKVYVFRFYDGERKYVSGRMHTEERFEDNIDFLRDEKLVKILYSKEDMNYLQKIAAEVSDITGDTDVSYSSNRYLEFNRKGVNKGAGLLRLAKILGVDQKDTIAIGDNFNDLAMIQAAGLGIGVANAVAGIRPDCKFITERDHNHDAISEVIEKFILNA